MKSIEFDPAIQGDPELMLSIRRGHEMVEAELGRHLKEISASWTVSLENRDQPRIRLDLSNSLDDAHISYPRSRLDDAREVYRMILWAAGELWSAETHRRLDEFQRDLPAVPEPSEAR